ncbi:AraC family transcriptional regulator ligand-binding domain-containing protein [Synechocystis sp. LKSZ1]|uniref:helix-turn-helix domain-containing protein n=1 Tax=Synechocystis sp. LKSZ1 TaxID=3144951 RepID=UPI00336BDAB6
MAPPIPLLRVVNLSPIITFLEEQGTPTEQFLRRAKLPVYALDDPYTLLPCHQVIAFLEDVSHQEGIDNLGWRVENRVSLTEYGAFGRLILQSLTLGEALLTSIRTLRLFNSGVHLWLQVRGEQAWFGHQFTQLNGLDFPCGIQIALLLMLDLIQKAAGRHWYPQEIYLQTPQISNLNHHPLSCTRIDQTQGFTAIVFPRSFLSLPLGQTPLADHQADLDLLQSLAPALDFVGSLQQALTPLLRENYPTIEVAAEIAQISVRTLQRRLAEEGLTYSQLISRLRYQRAIYWLVNSDLKMIEIAAELGYQDAAHFTRAFKRWTGVSPQAFRRDRQS